jgi:hypothetical protein
MAFAYCMLPLCNTVRRGCMAGCMRPTGGGPDCRTRPRSHARAGAMQLQAPNIFGPTVPALTGCAPQIYLPALVSIQKDLNTTSTATAASVAIYLFL